MKDVNIVRKIRLNKLGCYIIKSNEKDLFEFVKNNLLNLKAVKLDNYLEAIMYFNNDGKLMFKHNLKNSNLYTNDFIFNTLENEYRYKYDDIYDLVEYVLEKVYKIKNVYVSIFFLF